MAGVRQIWEQNYSKGCGLLPSQRRVEERRMQARAMRPLTALWIGLYSRSLQVLLVCGSFRLKSGFEQRMMNDSSLAAMFVVDFDILNPPCILLNAKVAAQKLRPVGNVKFSISSRTDSGVHAICNSAHVDIERTPDKAPFSEDILVKALNFHLHPEPICILKAFHVNDDFHARFDAVSRTYLYRVVTGCERKNLPVFERNLCWVASESHLDIPRIQEAAQFFVGKHDFRGFRSTNNETPFKSPVKTLQQADITPTTSLLPNLLQNSDLQYWDFTFKSQSFAYKQ
ncbi:unnamed protein product, partial [Ranitomeya imitator]